MKRGGGLYTPTTQLVQFRVYRTGECGTYILIYCKNRKWTRVSIKCMYVGRGVRRVRGLFGHSLRQLELRDDILEGGFGVVPWMSEGVYVL